MSTFHRDTYAQVIPLRFSIYQSAVSTAPQYKEDLPFSLQRRVAYSKRLVFASICLSLIASRKHFCTSILLFPAALVFLFVGIREVVQVCVGATLAVRRDCFAHHIHWTLEKCNDASSLMLG